MLLEGLLLRILLWVLKNIETHRERCQDTLSVLSIDADGTVKTVTISKERYSGDYTLND